MNEESSHETQRNRIPFLFTPIPKVFFNEGIFSKHELLVFICWAFNRCSAEKRKIMVGYRQIILDPWEFVFGRERCSIETKISVQTIRTILKSLGAQGVLQKVTSKSTSKFTVYGWIGEAFSDSSHRQDNQQTTDEQLDDHHKQEGKKKEESKRKVLFSGKAGGEEGCEKIAAGCFSEIKLPNEVGKMLSSLPLEEQEAVQELFKRRMSKKPIVNAGGWIRQCIEKGWHGTKTIEVHPERDFRSMFFEENRKVAEEVKQALENVNGVRIIIRKDFLELGRRDQGPWQIFYCESPAVFRSQMESVIRKIGLFPKKIIKL